MRRNTWIQKIEYWYYKGRDEGMVKWLKEINCVVMNEN